MCQTLSKRLLKHDPFNSHDTLNLSLTAFISQRGKLRQRISKLQNSQHQKMLEKELEHQCVAYNLCLSWSLCVNMA